ncbi:hypothetical protein HHL24_20655 [Paraburkholderia sp. RP-4-7]|uniref:Uncharacterized protein n=1 Tax=Paraburkholderia polaris TaxID=2728848 RepID=A0A848IG82_9BURK|nr:hypothetical protein [Paraburkholderia polaris]NMM00340.1 hypothetical protein [Paraburkholderia polaris]
MTEFITEAKRKELEDAFKAFTPTTQSTGAGTASTTSTLAGNFCTDWQRTKSVLQFIASLSMVPDFVKSAISTVISAGDVVSGILCSP